MRRFEAAIETPICFRTSGPGVDVFKAPDETVPITFEDRVFVWHAGGPSDDPHLVQIEYGPTVVTVLKDDGDSHIAPSILERLLSAIAFKADQPVFAAHYGGSPGADAFGRPITRSVRGRGGYFILEPFEAIEVRPEANLRLALAHYREGLTATSPFYRFLAYWNCLDATFGVERDSTDRNQFLNERGAMRKGQWETRMAPFPDDIAIVLEKDHRNAVAHVLRDPGRVRIDPDDGDDRVRLADAASFLRFLAWDAITAVFPYPVTAR